VFLWLITGHQLFSIVFFFVVVVVFNGVFVWALARTQVINDPVSQVHLTIQ